MSGARTFADEQHRIVARERLNVPRRALRRVRRVRRACAALACGLDGLGVLLLGAPLLHARVVVRERRAQLAAPPLAHGVEVTRRLSDREKKI